jgi:protein arginine N-methyltransferase 1
MYDTKPLEAFEFHQSMLADRVRTDGYLSALLQVIRPGDVVLDIGSGTGVLACFACLAGARKVYAIEQGAVIGLAREIISRNGLQDRVTFINDWSSHSALPELIDVLVTETIGNIGFDEGILHWVLDARQRLLKEGARIVPQSLAMFGVPVESDEAYAMVADWEHDYYTFDFSPLHTLAANNLLWADYKPPMFLAEPASLFAVDLARAAENDLTAAASYIVQRQGTMHGIGGWFAADLAEGIQLSNVPPNKTPSWSHSFLPLEVPLALEAGDRLDLQIHTSHRATRWQWQVTHFPAAGEGEPAALPEQSTADGELSSLINSSDLAHIPARNAQGEIDLFILQRMDGASSVEAIARQTAARFPQLLSSYGKALERVYHLLASYAGPE